MLVLIGVLCFLGGVVTTVGGLMAWGWYVGMKERIRIAEQHAADMEQAIKKVETDQQAAADALQQAIAEMVKRRQAAAPPAPTAKDPSASASVKDRLRKAVEITAKQSKIDPKKSPEFQMQHNELELEKLAVLKTILADGFDPVITIRYDNGPQDMLLSSYIESITKGLA